MLRGGRSFRAKSPWGQAREPVGMQGRAGLHTGRGERTPSREEDIMGGPEATFQGLYRRLSGRVKTYLGETFWHPGCPGEKFFKVVAHSIGQGKNLPGRDFLASWAKRREFLEIFRFRLSVRQFSLPSRFLTPARDNDRKFSLLKAFYSLWYRCFTLPRKFFWFG